MADNYIENRMAEHMAGCDCTKKRAAVKTARVVFVVDGLSAAGRAEVARLAATRGTAVAFAGNSHRDGYLLAKRTGARFFYVSSAEMLDRVITSAREFYGIEEFVVYK